MAQEGAQGGLAALPARVQTLHVSEAAHKAEIELADALAHQQGQRLRETLGRKRQRLDALAELNLRSSKQLVQARDALQALVVQHRAKIEAQRRRCAELAELTRVLEEETGLGDNSDGENQAWAGNDAHASEAAAKDLNRRLTNAAGALLATHFDVREETLWRRFLRMPEELEVSEEDAATPGIEALLACGICTSDPDAQDEAPPGKRRLGVVRGPRA